MNKEKIIESIENMNLPIEKIEVTHNVEIYVDNRTKISAVVDKIYGPEIKVIDVTPYFFNRSQRKWKYKMLSGYEKNLLSNYIQQIIHSGGAVENYD